MVPPGTPAPRTDLLLPLKSSWAHAPGQPRYYVLERRDPRGDVAQRGMLGALSLRGPDTGHVLRHQQVGEVGVRTQTRLLEERDGTPPLLLAAPDLGAFQECLERTISRPPDTEERTPEGGVQRLWVCDPAWSEHPPALPPVLLADGHHRLEAARRRYRAHPGAAADRLPALVVDHRHFPLRLAATHRIVPGLDIGRAVRAASRIARVTPHPPHLRPRPAQGSFLLSGGGKCWDITEISPAAMAGRLRFMPPEWAELPAAVSDHVLIPVLCEDQGLKPEPRYSSRPPGPAEAGLVLPPPTWEQIWSGAASGTGMPAKSTSFSPLPAVAVPGWAHR